MLGITRISTSVDDSRVYTAFSCLTCLWFSMARDDFFQRVILPDTFSYRVPLLKFASTVVPVTEECSRRLLLPF